MEKKKRILIIDDNPIYYSDVIDDLKQEYDVDVVLNLREASHSLKNNYYDLAIMDIAMPIYGYKFENPYRTGLDYFYSHIRLEYPKMKIIFWSAVISKCTINDYFKDKGGTPQNVDIFPKGDYNYNNEEFKRFINSILFS